MSKNTCYTHFRITGDYDPDFVTDRLGLQPDRFWRIGDKRRNGTEYDFTCWEIGHCEEYDVLTDNQMHKTIAPLIPIFTHRYTVLTHVPLFCQTDKRGGYFL